MISTKFKHNTIFSIVMAFLLCYIMFSLPLHTQYKEINVGDEVVLDVADIRSPLEIRVSAYILYKNADLEQAVADTLASVIIKESNINHIKVNLILGIIEAESNFDQYAISPASAIGYMQILPKWHKDKIAELENRDIYAPESNIHLGVRILKDCMELHHHNIRKSLSCYNGSQNDTTMKYAKTVLSKVPKVV